MDRAGCETELMIVRKNAGHGITIM
jgi:hypothetical protein